MKQEDKGSSQLSSSFSSTMRLYGALILFLSVSTAYGIQCYICTRTKLQSCTEAQNCTREYDQCFSVVNDEGLITKGCGNDPTCQAPTTCCKEDLCNNAIPTGPSVFLLLVCSVIFTRFL